MKINLTENEKHALKAYLASDYHDSRDPRTEDSDVWLFSVATPELNGQALGGVLSSLKSKGIVRMWGSIGDDGTIELTEQGRELVRELGI